MKRRDALTILGGAAAWPFGAHAQQPERVRKIGWLSALDGNDPEVRAWARAFQEELQRRGWEEGRNIRIEYRSAASDLDRLHSNAAELVRMMPDVLFANATPALLALSRETRSVPIVFV
ncbi:MAG: ABC transporter substrate-binding protein, partial [Alphaproteobacteria bacterium]